MAKAATSAVDFPAARNAYLPVGGPEAGSWRNIVAVCGRLVGRELPVQHVG